MRRFLPFLLVLLPIAVVAAIGFIGVATDDASPGDTGGGETAGPDEGAVAIDGFEFAPGDLTVAVGTEVTWTNMDGSPHSIQDDSGEELFAESDELGEGDTFAFTFEQAGDYAYICGVHNYMQASVTVTG